MGFFRASQPPDNFVACGNVHWRRGQADLRGEFERDVIQCSAIRRPNGVDSKQEGSIGGNRRLPQITIDPHHQQRNRNDDVQQRLECKFQVATRPPQNLAVRAHYHRNLVAIEAHRQQMRFQLILRDADGFLV